MSSHDKTRQASRGDAAAALSKGLEFAEASQPELASKRWNAAALSAVHSGISAADAVLAASAGLRSSSQDHGAVIALLEAQVPEFSATQRRQLGGLLKMKNIVAYEQRTVSEVEARQLVDHAARLASWAARTVKAHS